MDTLKQVLEKEMREYAGKGLNGFTHFTHSDDKSVMSLVFVGQIQERKFSSTSILARIAGDKIIIEDDKTNKPLVDALLQAGIPREQIVLAYAGEKIEESA
jgi:hypothetical protein